MTRSAQLVAREELGLLVDLLAAPDRKVVVVCAIVEGDEAVVGRAASAKTSIREASALLTALDAERARIAALIEEAI